MFATFSLERYLSGVFMQLLLQIFVFNAVFIALFIIVHEVGHYTMGRLAGLPVAEMRIRLLTFPQHVALRDGTEWISVSDLQRYLELMRRHVPSVRGQLVYISGGFLFETTFTMLMAVILQMAGIELFAVIIVGLSLLFYLVYLLALDLPHARATGEPYGDSTLMYTLAPTLAICWSIGMVVIRIGLVIALLWWL